MKWGLRLLSIWIVVLGICVIFGPLSEGLGYKTISQILGVIFLGTTGIALLFVIFAGAFLIWNMANDA